MCGRTGRTIIVDAQVIHTFPKSEDVWGVTLLNNELYVLRKRYTDQVDVYSTTDFTLLRRLIIKGLSRDGMQDITSCVQKQRVYIADAGTFYIHGIGLNGSLNKWSLTGKARGLSVTRSCNLLVTCYDGLGVRSELVELSSEDGRPVRDIMLQSSIVRPWHSIQLTNKKYVVCHGDDSGNSRVSLVWSDGGVTQTRDVGLSRPRHMAVDVDGFIFVTDSGKKRIVLFDPSLNYVRDILEHMRFKPKRLCYDDVTRCLHVGQEDRIVSVVQL